MKLASFLLFAVATSALATEPLTPELAIQRRQIRDLQLSPDGSRVAFVVVEPPKGEKQRSDLWIFEIETGDSWRLTTAEARDEHPRWSPDGAWIAFISDRGEKPQIFRISLGGGEAEALTDVETGASSVEWSPDGKSLVYLAEEKKTEEEKKKEGEKDDGRAVDKDDRHARLWRLDLATRESKQLTSGAFRLSELTWTPGADALVLAATDHPRPELFTERIYRLSLSDDKLTELAAPAGPFGNLKVSPDGKTLAFTGSRDDGPSPHDLFLLPLSGGEARNVTAESIDRAVDDFYWRTNEELTVKVEDGFTSRFYEVTTDGTAAKRPAFPGIHPLGSFVVGPRGYVFVGEAPTKLPELWVSSEAGVAEPRTSFQEAFREIDLMDSELVSFESSDGTPIEAALLRPAGNRPVPAVILVHGGPTGRWAFSFHDWGQLLVSHGFAVLYPNIRGSSSYGFDFLAANRRDWGGGDFQDVLAAADYLVKEKIADPNELGIGGWSYGGYMAAWAVTQTDRFRVSVSGAPMTNLVSEYGTEMSSINSYDTWFLGNPYENLALFAERSPLTHVKSTTTPTLILCGENDVTDPIGQCTEFYRGLARYDVETELVLYPREGHGFREEKHRVDVLRRMVDWFDAHLGAAPSSSNDAPSDRVREERW